MTREERRYWRTQYIKLAVIIICHGNKELHRLSRACLDDFETQDWR